MGPQRNHHNNNNNNNGISNTHGRINKEWTCCFGLHVHTATLMIGLWHLVSEITSQYP